MNRIYLDNAATAFPKAPGVAEAVYAYLTSIGSNINRGYYAEALMAEEIVYETRELICHLFKTPDPDHVVFTKNITESLNLVINSLFKPGDHVMVSSMEHNAVLRPLHHLQKKYNGSLDIGILPCNEHGELPTGNELMALLSDNLQPHTKAIIMTHASNVCGTIMPVKEIGDFCQKHQLIFILDTAQTAGVLEINNQEIQADAIAFTGHKSLLGPQGIGGIVLSKTLAGRLEPLITGGTGSSSDDVFQPCFMPDRFEAGTLNIPGIYGLHKGLQYLHEKSIDNIRERQNTLARQLLVKIEKCCHLRFVGTPDHNNRTAVLSFDFPDKDNALISHALSTQYGIINRCGLHCAPMAHKTLGTFPNGTVRLSFSHFNTEEDVEITAKALQDCAQL